jgi:hypothetical protein|tara:strand:- start:3891 stop:4469 length:579 start_codon:yes stop_codon:yes gene_type:complete
MTKYNGAIQVRPCTVINIPQPGVIQEINDGNYDGTGPQPILTGMSPATTQLLIDNNIGGGDVVYITDIGTGAEYIFQIEYLDVPSNTLLFFDICSPPAVVLAAADITVEIYRGNYNPTTGTTAAPGGPTGAGNSEGYSILCDQAVTLTVLTVNNDLVNIPYAQDRPNDLQVVKVLSVVGGVGVNITALKVQE